jgi:hypothetical protein
MLWNPGGLAWLFFRVKIELISINFVVILWKFTGRDSRVICSKKFMNVIDRMNIE